MRAGTAATVGLITMLSAAMAAGQEPPATRPAKEKLLLGKTEVNEGRRILVEEDSYPREPARIVAGPTVARRADGWAIRFELDKPDDVLVRIVDAQGNTVRNLACGVLGWNAPAPLAPDRLAQEVAWDGKDARGEPAPPGCKAHLGVGLGPRFDRFIAYDPKQLLPKLCALEVDRQGRLYVGLFTSRRGDMHLVRYDRQGEYLETCFPPNLNRLADKLENATRRVNHVDGQAVPAKRGFWPFFTYRYKYGENEEAKYDTDSSHHWFPIRLTSDGRAFLADTVAGLDSLYGGWAGSNQESKSLGVAVLIERDWTTKVRVMPVRLDPFWFMEYFSSGAGPWAVDPAGNAYFIKDNQTGKASLLKATIDGLKACNDFAYNGLTALPAKTCVLKPSQGPDQPPLFGTVVDLTADAEGNIYLANRPAARKGQVGPVAVELKALKANGQPATVLGDYELGGQKRSLGSVYGVRVAGKALFVAVRDDPIIEKKQLVGWRAGRLVKFNLSAGPELKAVWEAPLSAEAHLVAVDQNVDPPLVWVGNGNGPATLTRIADGGDRPGEVRHFGSGVRQGVLLDPWAVALDGDGRLLVYDYQREKIIRVNDDGTGWEESEPIGRCQTYLCYDRDRDFLYVSQRRAFRLGKDLKRDLALGRQVAPVGLSLGAVDRDGRLYGGDMRKAPPQGEPFIGAVRRFGPDGKPEEADFCLTYTQPGGVAIDSKGFVYTTDVCVADVKQGSHDLLTAGWSRGGRPVTMQSEIAYLLKFPPAGGTRLSADELWAHRGVSPLVTGQCWCSVAANCLCIDEADRIFATDYVRYHVKVLDTAGNLIARIGACGNADCQGPASKFPDPPIAFWWLHSIDARGDSLVASDRDLRRVVKVRLDYRQTAQAAVP